MHQPTFLIVDDDPPSLRLYSRMLDSAGLFSVCFDSPQRALSMLGSLPAIEVVLTDLNMPNLGGIELIELARRRHSNRPWLQFIVVTGAATTESAVQALRLQASDYIHKPATRLEIVESATRALKVATALRALRGAAGEPTSEVDYALTEPHITKEPANSRSLLRNMLSHKLTDQCLHREILGEGLSSSSACEMLLELMNMHLQARRTSVTALCLATLDPMTTALRRVGELVDIGLVARVPDPSDSRRAFVELTENGRAKVEKYLLALAASIQSPPPGSQ